MSSKFDPHFFYLTYSLLRYVGAKEYSAKNLRFQPFVHVYILTVVVVLLSISSMFLIAVGCIKDKRKALGIGTIAALVLMASGPVRMALSKEVFGIFEHFSTYSAVIYSGILSIFLYKGKDFAG